MERKMAQDVNHYPGPNVLPDLKNKIYGGAWSIHDYRTVNAVKKWSKYFDISSKANIQGFINDYSFWMQQGHNLLGIQDFKHLAFANGTTEVFDKFYMKHTGRRLRLWRGEYFYHQIVARESFDNNFAWIDEDEIRSNDVVVVSMPFSDTGNVVENYEQIMTDCCKLNVPVLIDMAYINISKHKQYNLEFDCIKTLATSLSKVFPVETYRIGMRMNRDNEDDTLNAYTNNSTPYVNTHSINIAHQLIKEYPNSWVYDNYAMKQEILCRELWITPSDCVIFGIDENNKYTEYNRGGKTNRLCFSKLWDFRQ